MSLWTRVRNVFRRDRLSEEIDEEFRLHMEEGVEAGRDPAEVRRAFGPLLRTREASADARLAVWLDALRADVVFGWRLLVKNRTVTGAAVLSLALTIGACTAAFRLVDAMLLRPLPVAAPERLYVLAYEFLDQNGKKDLGDTFEYPLFRQLRDAVKGQAEVLAISYAGRIDLTYGSDDAMEKAYWQLVSGRTFGALGLKPVIGRLLTAADDVTPGGHPHAVISHDYWKRRFGGDPKAVGRTLRNGNDVYEIVGVGPEGFTGTETGVMTDLFVPTMMNSSAINNPNWGWFRTWVQPKPGVQAEAVQQQLALTFRRYRQERVRNWKGVSQKRVEEYARAALRLEPAAAGVSKLQKSHGRALVILGVLVLLLLLIACVNVANLMLAQVAARTREMALRIAIGAGRGRLVQLVLVEGILMTVLATVLGGLFAWWSAPFVVGLINPPDDPARLLLPADGRLLGFTSMLTAGVVFLFGLAPALRVSGVKPMAALKGGGDPRSRRRLMHALMAAQVAFCFLVHFVAGLFVTTFERLSNQPTGFRTERLLVLETVAKEDRPYEEWQQLAEHLRAVPGVEQVARSRFPLMSGSAWTEDVRVGGADWDAPEPYVLSVTPGWLQTMGIGLIGGRDFRREEEESKVAVVNEAFAKRYFDGQNPVGRTFEVSPGAKPMRVTITGWVRDARYRDMREAIRPTIYYPLRSSDAKGATKGSRSGALMMRTVGPEPMALAATLRTEVARFRAGFRVSSVSTQQELVDSHTVRERLLAMLSLFFAAVALVLAGVGLYGVLNYSVQQRRREIGIRMALGAQPGDVAWRVTAEVFGMLVLGSVLGLAGGLASERYLETLLYQVKATDWTMVAAPVVTILFAGLMAAVPPVLAAVRVDPARVLRAE